MDFTVRLPIDNAYVSETYGSHQFSGLFSQFSCFIFLTDLFSFSYFEQ